MKTNGPSERRRWHNCQKCTGKYVGVRNGRESSGLGDCEDGRSSGVGGMEGHVERSWAKVVWEPLRDFGVRKG